ncbi:MAG TPA: hypothetical protein VM451_05275 [Candidatus Limnocylindria bacterium]|nr:hypothetical protein [Candidatus Limnocylindria bacterium]
MAWASPPPPLSQTRRYAGGPPRFTVGALLKDSFARYGADPIRLFLVSLVISVVSYGSSLASFASNPLLTTSGSSLNRPFVDVSGILGLLNLVVSFVGMGVIYALLEGGPKLPFGRAFARGLHRSGWAFLTVLLLGVAFFVVFLLAIIPGIIFALAGTTAFIIYFFVAFLVIVWLAIRVTLALPAVVVDNLNSIDAFKLSWHATKPAGVWGRVVLAGLALGLILIPATLGGALLILPAILGGQPWLLIPVALAFTIVTPLGSTLLYSAYRRLVPPFLPSWAGHAGVATPPDAAAAMPEDAAAASAAMAEPVATAAMAMDAPVEAPLSPPTLAPLVDWATPAAPPPPAQGWVQPAAPAAWAAAGVPGAPGAPGAAAPQLDAPAFVEPQLGSGAKAILAVLLAMTIAGVLAVPYVILQFTSGQLQLPSFPTFPTSPNGPGTPTSPGFPGLSGNVARGTVAFGTSADLSTCTVDSQTVFMPATNKFFWMAQLTRRTTVSDAVRLRITLDGEEIVNAPQDPGVYDCLGTEQAETGLGAGVYVFEVLINGQVNATGTIISS